MASHGEKLLGKFLERLQQNPNVRRGIGIALVAAILAGAGYFVFQMIPRQYTLTITGGEILGNRHFVAKAMQESAAEAGLTLRIKPTHGTFEGLEAVEAGTLDLALVQGGLEGNYPNVQHVATLAPELVHFLVRPEIKAVQDLKGKSINLGSKSGGTRVVAKQILGLSGLEEGIDYVEVNHGVDDIVGMRPERLPDAVVNVSFLPSYLADFLVKERGYRLLEMPFPSSLALRLGWVADGRILGYMYSISPPVPAADIKVVGVNLHLVANRNVDPKAVYKALEVLYSPTVASRLRMRLDETNIALPSGYPLSDGTLAFMARNSPMLSAKLLDQAKSLFGLIMTSLSAFIVLWRWFSGQQSTEDKAFKGYVKQVGEIEREIRVIDLNENATEADIAAVAARLSELKEKALKEYPSGMFKNDSVVDKLLAGIADTRRYLLAVRARVESRRAAAAAPAPEPVA
ncbi:TAXI family TRAP transporter solute-binding subunit [Azospirillum sp.]|uniref:TAXI family TRAP transporter solute-binding subunit n=1 Tax=Azospirillum sp. TaxID=34012 RepID=UPI002D6955A4|nr:TAXI family TRAP transporter solute-binding subunit [Azospirillum sp.]HYD65866.1 TAXI family TRAP transporter solute-binding subunit [Azospirillum sp.]